MPHDPTRFNAADHLGTHLLQFLVGEGIDDPVLCAEPETELRALALRFLAYLRQRRSRTGRALSATSVG